MNWILINFTVAFCIALIATPVCRRLGIRWGVLDTPGVRKLHSGAIPRSGGVAIVLAFTAAVLVPAAFPSILTDGVPLDGRIGFFLAGGLITFGIGFLDDLYRLRPGTKFYCQILAASVAFWGGLRIDRFLAFGLENPFGIPSYLVTVFWFLLFTNAINLLDGLDGLAAGVTFFTCAVMAILSGWRDNYPLAALFAALAGANLGFLRYNFNPASIFMGDGGSYFLGYAIAGLSIIGLTKSQVGATMLIPLIALGIPIFDTLLSPIRRFLLGKDMFRPDRGHIHHKLVAMGLSNQRVVWIIYGLSSMLCVSAVILVHLHSREAGIFLLLLGVVAVLFIRKLGYLEYFASDKIYGWIKDVTDEAGLSRERRTFLHLQIEIGKSRGLEELWGNICRALTMLDFDMAEIHLQDRNVFQPAAALAPLAETPGDKDRSARLDLSRDPSEGKSAEWLWTKDGFDARKDLCEHCLLKLELPLLDDDSASLGTLWLIKDLRRNSFGHYTLRRVEHLRRTVTRTLAGMRDKTPSAQGPSKAEYRISNIEERRTNNEYRISNNE